MIRMSNTDVGGRVVELAETRYMVRGRGYLRGIADLEKLVVKATGGAGVDSRYRSRRAGAGRTARHRRAQWQKAKWSAALPWRATARMPST